MRGTLLSPPAPSIPALPPDDPPPGEEVTRWPPGMEVAVAVRGFAIETVQRTLEVLDGRRPRAQLAGVVTDDVRCQIIALIQHGVVRREDDAARLRRMHVQVRSATGAEFFGSFSRGERVRALAGRIEPRRVRVSALGEVPRRVGTRLLLTEFAVL